MDEYRQAQEIKTQANWITDDRRVAQAAYEGRQGQSFDPDVFEFAFARKAQDCQSIYLIDMACTQLLEVVVIANVIWLALQDGAVSGGEKIGIIRLQQIIEVILILRIGLKNWFVFGFQLR